MSVKSFINIFKWIECRVWPASTNAIDQVSWGSDQDKWQLWTHIRVGNSTQHIENVNLVTSCKQYIAKGNNSGKSNWKRPKERAKENRSKINQVHIAMERMNGRQLYSSECMYVCMYVSIELITQPPSLIIGQLRAHEPQWTKFGWVQVQMFNSVKWDPIVYTHWLQLNQSNKVERTMENEIMST